MSSSIRVKGGGAEKGSRSLKGHQKCVIGIIECDWRVKAAIENLLCQCQCFQFETTDYIFMTDTVHGSA